MPRLLTACIVAPVAALNSFTFAGGTDAAMTINVMNQLYTNCTAFTT